MRRVDRAGLVVGLVIFLGCASDARAGRVSVGTDESIRTIQPTKDPAYNLGYKTSTFFLVAGCYVKDDGYVLQKVGEPKKYIPLDPAMIQRLQQEDILPTPLPAYSLSFFDYLFGYSNWILLGFFVGIPLAKSGWAKLRGPSGPVSAPGPETGHEGADVQPHA